MTFPKISLTVRDPGLGVSAPTPNTPIYSGKAFGGSATVDTIVSVGQLSDVRTILGYGPLAEDVALCLQQAGGPVLAIVHADSSTPVADTMSKSGSGPDITLAGVPADDYALQIKIIVGGARGTATFQYSLDAFNANVATPTLSQIRTVPSGGTFVIPNTGITATFATGTYVAGDSYTQALAAPVVATGDLATVGALLEAATSSVFYLWSVCGMQVSATTAATLAAALEGYCDALTTTFRYIRAFMDIGSGDTESNVATESATWTGVRVAPSYGYVLRTSAIPYEGFGIRKCSPQAGMAARATKVVPSSDLSETADGPDVGVLFIAFDENGDQTLDALNIGGMRVWPGFAGFYIANCPLKHAFGSDFTDLQLGRVMDIACRTTFEGEFPYISASLRTTTSGGIDPRDAKKIESSVNGRLRDAILSPLNSSGNLGYASDAVFAVDLTQDLNTSGILKSSVGIRPLGYSKVISTDLFFTLTPGA